MKPSTVIFVNRAAVALAVFSLIASLALLAFGSTILIVIDALRRELVEGIKNDQSIGGRMDEFKAKVSGAEASYADVLTEISTLKNLTQAKERMVNAGLSSLEAAIESLDGTITTASNMLEARENTLNGLQNNLADDTAYITGTLPTASALAQSALTEQAGMDAIHAYFDPKEVIANSEKTRWENSIANLAAQAQALQTQAQGMATDPQASEALRESLFADPLPQPFTAPLVNGAAVIAVTSTSTISAPQGRFMAAVGDAVAVFRWTCSSTSPLTGCKAFIEWTGNTPSQTINFRSTYVFMDSTGADPHLYVAIKVNNQANGDVSVNMLSGNMQLGTSVYPNPPGSYAFVGAALTARTLNQLGYVNVPQLPQLPSTFIDIDPNTHDPYEALLECTLATRQWGYATLFMMQAPEVFGTPNIRCFGTLGATYSPLGFPGITVDPIPPFLGMGAYGVYPNPYAPYYLL